MKVVLTVEGMHCIGCESLVSDAVGELDGIEAVNASHKTGKVSVVFDKSKVSAEQIREAIAGAGYGVE